MSQWISVKDELPGSTRKVLAVYKNKLGHWRTIIAKWIEAKTLEAEGDCWEYELTEYDEDSDCYWVKPGWFECIENWDEYTMITVHEGEITHWMPLPPKPEDASSPKGT